MNAEINIRQVSWFIIACLLVFLPGLLVDVMNIDAAQYASISREMLASKNWLEVYHLNGDYLDKPPLLFWLSATSFKIFGVNNFAYKLPSFLFAVLGIFSTIKLGELFYGRKTGMVAGLMLTFSLGMFVMTNDIRTDTILLGSTIFATWKILHYLKTKSRLSFVLGFLGVGIAMLAKGPLGFILTAAALSADFFYKRQWKNFVRVEWIIGLLIIALLLFPMCYGLYTQFDLHPEKNIDGHNGVSGLRFYFWTQSFGRITGESDWGSKFDNGAGPFFFTHTFLWVFFPWSLFLVGGLLKNFIVLVKTKFKPGFLPEVVSTGGFVLVFIALSASRYKLPHYVYVLLPLASVLSARFLMHDVLNAERKKLFRTFYVLHWIFFIALASVCVFFLFVVFPGAPILTFVAVGCLLFCGIVLAFRLHNPFEKLLFPMLLALIAFYFIGNTHFYPSLLHYQSGNEIGKVMRTKNIPEGGLIYLNQSDHALDFYYGTHVHSVFISDSLVMREKIKQFGKLYVITDKEGREELKSHGFVILSKIEFDHFRVQFLTMNFLLPSKRDSTLGTKFVLEIN
ncbi:MAG: glycosyltransferase family 39 protein [Bacteroidota bacterium]|nr:glycosyltransferase family 39 protein [Bacteroidota bacterium]